MGCDQWPGNENSVHSLGKLGFLIEFCRRFTSSTSFPVSQMDKGGLLANLTARFEGGRSKREPFSENVSPG